MVNRFDAKGQPASSNTAYEMRRKRKGSPSPTITEVARHAGVSPSTVSYVLTGNRSISEETQARVRSSIAELNYRRHAVGRALRAGKTNVVALVVPFYDWLSEPVIMPYVYGVVDAARRHRWNVMLVTGESADADVDEVVGSKMVDGVVLMEVRVDDERLTMIEQLAIPAVCLGMPSEPATVPFVDFDFQQAGRLCVEHLVGLGHRQIGLLASPPGTFENNLGYAQRLWHGVADSLADAGLSFHGLPMEPTMEGAQRAVDTLLAEEPALTGLIVHSEGTIDMLMQVLQRRGRAVPGDISVIAIAWGELTKHVVPPLTYVNVPAVEMGRTAIELLAEQGSSKLLSATLVAGGTVAPPPAR
jgi:DNA-binding LacI/PurR family transcriptional regulator